MSLERRERWGNLPLHPKLCFLLPQFLKDGYGNKPNCLIIRHELDQDAWQIPVLGDTYPTRKRPSFEGWLTRGHRFWKNIFNRPCFLKKRNLTVKSFFFFLFLNRTPGSVRASTRDHRFQRTRLLLSCSVPESSNKLWAKNLKKKTRSRVWPFSNLKCSTALRLPWTARVVGSRLYGREQGF